MSNIRQRKTLNEFVKEISFGVLRETVDIILWDLVYMAGVATTFERNTWQARINADKFLEEVNFETIKNSINYLRRKGLVKKTGKTRKTWPEITKAGRERLYKIVPQYEEKRVWDRKIYLITYDIPEEKKSDRELFRRFLKKAGIVLLQESVWLTPFDPQDIIRNFVSRKKLEGTMIVSSIGKDGFIGDEDIKTLVVRIYKLEDLNERYKEFIGKIKSKKYISRMQMQFAYLSILKDDPQLPFELLPSDWVGNNAYKVFETLIE